MSTQIDRAYVNQFSANILQLAQQMSARLLGAVRVETQNAEFAFYDQVGAVVAVERVTRHADTPFTEVPHSRRRVSMRDWELSEIVDAQDLIRMLSDPTSAYTQMFGAALAREMDRTIISAALGTAITGKTGADSVAFPAGQVIAVDYVETGSATNSSLTVAKLRRARELLMDAEVGDGGLCIVCTQREISSLLRTTEVSSSDFNSVRALVNGEINQFMGFDFIRLPSTHPGGVNVFPVPAANVRSIPVWHREGVLFARGEAPVVKAAEDPTKGFNTRLYARASFGATRMEEVRVVDIRVATNVF